MKPVLLAGPPGFRCVATDVLMMLLMPLVACGQGSGPRSSAQVPGRAGNEGLRRALRAWGRPE